MIDNHLTFRQIEDYVAKRLPWPGARFPPCRNTVATCPSCSAMLQDSVIAAAVDHPTEKQMVDLVAGLLPASESQRTKIHIESCAACAAMVEDLEGFRETQPASGRPHRPAIRRWLLPVAAVVIAAAGVSVWLASRPGPSAPKVIAQLRDGDGVLQLSEAGALLPPPPACLSRTSWEVLKSRFAIRPSARRAA